MNKRIKELLEQANIKFDKSLEEIDVCVCLPSDLEKFAELIIGECLDYCGENLSKTVAGAVKIHLGVDDEVRENV